MAQRPTCNEHNFIHCPCLYHDDTAPFDVAALLNKLNETPPDCDDLPQCPQHNKYLDVRTHYYGDECPGGHYGNPDPNANCPGHYYDHDVHPPAPVNDDDRNYWGATYNYNDGCPD